MTRKQTTLEVNSHNDKMRYMYSKEHCWAVCHIGAPCGGAELMGAVRRSETTLCLQGPTLSAAIPNRLCSGRAQPRLAGLRPLCTWLSSGCKDKATHYLHVPLVLQLHGYLSVNGW